MNWILTDATCAWFSAYIKQYSFIFNLLQLKQKTEALAAGLLQLGLKDEDFALISGITCMNWILVDLACACIGVHTVRCNVTALQKESLEAICARNNIKVIFYHPGEKGEFEEHLMRCSSKAFQEKIERIDEESAERNQKDITRENLKGNKGRKIQQKDAKGSKTAILGVKYLIRLYPSDMHSTKKPVTTMLTYPWKCTVLHCNHLGNTWKPLVLMTRHFDYCPSARGRLAWWLLAFLHSGLKCECKPVFVICFLERYVNQQGWLDPYR